MTSDLQQMENRKSFMCTPQIWLGLRPSIIFMNKLKILDVSSSNFCSPYKWRASVRKKRYLSLYVFFCFHQTWNNWLCDFSAEVRLKQRPCNPYVRFWVKQQTDLGLSTCKISTLCSFFLCYTTRRRRFYWNSLLVLPSRPLCTQSWINPTSCCFRVPKIN